MMACDVIIVGAGITGLTCAKELQSAGLVVQVIEARGYAGGRAVGPHSLDSPTSDRSALFLHDYIHHPLKELVESLGATVVPVSYENITVYDQDGSPLSYQEMNALTELSLDFADAIHGLYLECDEDKCLADLVSSALSEADDLLPIERRALDWVIANREFESWLCASRQSYRALVAPELSPDNDPDESPPTDVILVDGIGPIIEALKRDLDIRFSCPVTAIRRVGESMAVETSSHGAFQAKYVVMTVPIGVLQNGSIDFQPPLSPQHLTAIQGLGSGERIQVTLEYADAFWPKHSHFFGLLSERPCTFPQFVNLYPLTGQRQLIALAPDSVSQRISAHRDEHIAAIAQDAVTQMFGHLSTNPTHVSVTRWIPSPYSLGAGSGIPVGSDPRLRRQLEQIHNRIVFAGEAADSHHPSSLAGAADSGKRVAQIILTQR